MQTPYGHLTYCTNIHSGESWGDHFAQLQQHVPIIKKSFSPNAPFGLGLRLSNRASQDLLQPEARKEFKDWLAAQEVYVFTMNGFPYGGFHHTVVKDAVHAPDWQTGERLEYTVRLANILAELLPQGMEGGISTSPLSYKYWFDDEVEREAALAKGTETILHAVAELVKIKAESGKTIHLDIEPEPDGLLENGEEFLQWYTKILLPAGVQYLQQHFGWDAEKAEAVIKEHVQLCYDVCHFAIGYEDSQAYLLQLEKRGIKVGKLQISAALKVDIPSHAASQQKVWNALATFNEPVYLHQVVCRTEAGDLLRYRDLPMALADEAASKAVEWRAHFHVPIFNAAYEPLESTQSDIVAVLQRQLAQPFTQHLEVETYTWEVLPQRMKLPLTASIVRELQWVESILLKDKSNS